MLTYVYLCVIIFFRIHMCSLTKYKERDIMFSNAGKKLKVLAWLNLIISSLGGYFLGAAAAKELPKKDQTTTIIIYVAFGVVIGFVISIVIYAFGELCDNVMTIRNTLLNDTKPEKSVQNNDNQSNWICSCCSQNPNYLYQCKVCRRKRPE